MACHSNEEEKGGRNKTNYGSSRVHAADDPVIACDLPAVGQLNVGREVVPDAHRLSKRIVA